MKIDIETLRQTKGIGGKTLERIIEQHNKNENIKSFKSKYISSDKYKIDKDINLWQGDCLELMNHIPDKSVDMVLCDLPYGTTACSWDVIIPFEPLWSHYKRIIKDNGAIVLFGSEPFSTKLRMSNLDWYKYDWIWNKSRANNFLTAEKQPLKKHENISVFYNNRCTYNPQKYDVLEIKDIEEMYLQGGISSLRNLFKDRDYYRYGVVDRRKNIRNPKNNKQNVGIEITRTRKKDDGSRFPNSILYFNNAKQPTLHPTQKPIELLEYLIKTYTVEDAMILDNTMGSGSTGVACRNTNRRFIGIELDKDYFDIAANSIKNI